MEDEVAALVSLSPLGYLVKHRHLDRSDRFSSGHRQRLRNVQGWVYVSPKTFIMLDDDTNDSRVLSA
jgi:hypothetical protein